MTTMFRRDRIVRSGGRGPAVLPYRIHWASPVAGRSAAAMVPARRGPIPGTAAISSGVAADSLRTEPNR